MPQFITLPPRTNPLGDAFGAFGAGVSKGMTGEMDRRQKMADQIAAEERAKAARQAEIQGSQAFQESRDKAQFQAQKDLQDAMMSRQLEVAKATKAAEIEAKQKEQQALIDSFAGPRRQQIILPPQMDEHGQMFSPDVPPGESKREQFMRAMDEAQRRGVKEFGDIKFQGQFENANSKILRSVLSKSPSAARVYYETGDADQALAVAAEEKAHRDLAYYTKLQNDATNLAISLGIKQDDARLQQALNAAKAGISAANAGVGPIDRAAGAFGYETDDAAKARIAGELEAFIRSLGSASPDVKQFSAPPPTAPTTVPTPGVAGTPKGFTKTATNPDTGSKIYLVGGRWVNQDGTPVK